VTGTGGADEEDENATARNPAAAEVAAASTQSIDAVRAAVRERLLDSMNARLRDLSAKGDSLGVEIDRIDWTALLPPEAKLAFDSVLTAAQKADQNIAAANTAAELRRQGAQREADRLTAAAQAVALERTVQATVDTTSIDAIERTSGSHAGLAEQAYRNQIGQVLGKAGNVVAIDPNGGQRVLMTGPPRPGPK
jgi:regulator of protease activity HflC (stomatin/prohibitin superfamily)